MSCYYCYYEDNNYNATIDLKYIKAMIPGFIYNYRDTFYTDSIINLFCHQVFQVVSCQALIKGGRIGNLIVS